jgi:hypothetical protein
LVSTLSPTGPSEDERAAADQDARLAAKTCRAMLALPVFAHDFPIQMLAKMAADEKLPPRERTNCLRTLAMIQMKALEMLALADAALAARSAGATAIAVSQVEQTVRVEIVRGRDWRDTVVDVAPAVAAVDAPAEAPAERNGS